MVTTNVSKRKGSKRRIPNTSKQNNGSTSSLVYSDGNTNKRKRTLLNSDSDTTKTTGSPTTDVNSACIETAEKNDSCSKSGPGVTAPPASDDVNIPNTVPRLESDPDTIGLADRQIVTPAVLHAVVPQNHSIAEHAKMVANKVHQSLEQFIADKSQKADGCYDPLRKLVQDRSAFDKGGRKVRFTHEKHLYSSIDALVQFVAKTTVDVATPHDDTDNCPRKFDTYIGNSSRPKMNPPYKWPNAAITFDDKKKPCFSDRPNHWHSLALIEARRSYEEQMDALEHLTTYAWNLYAYRLDRKFVWGFTVCNSIFRACLCSHDNVFVSNAMDVATAKGRMQLVSLLVNMAFCDSSQLGYDATIRYDPAVNEWEIDVYDDEKNAKDVFWVDQVRPFEKTTFGNQARILRCLKPGPSARADADNDESNYIYVKDSWAGCNELANDGDCDEIYVLRKIANVLGSDTELEGTFPKLLSGGGVRQQIAENGSTLLETTDTLLAVLGGNVVKGITKRVHRRLAATPFALPISQLRSVDELIVVVSDVMTAYMAIAQRCGILHRDISSNNIMFTRKPDGSVQGVLVDFDISMPVEDSELESREPDMRGTFPFMSIGNLTNSPLPRTVLDDWESLIYVLCWLCTYGFSKECGCRSKRDSAPMLNREWLSGGNMWAGTFKRNVMSLDIMFGHGVIRNVITKNGYAPLENLVWYLYNALFHNYNLTPQAHGTHIISPREYNSIMEDLRQKQNQTSPLSKHQHWDYNVGKDMIDPFERRQMFKNEIAENLLDI
ncbi:hypothetical protein LPJ73_003457, partial [Coemansia sp. RSA 2703]